MLEIEKINGKRSVLGERIPLLAPLSLNLTVADVCNLKCEFCINSMQRTPRKAFLDFDTAKLITDSCLNSFGEKGIQQIVFGGTGEPLLNSQVAKIADYMVKSRAFKEVHIVTNATALTRSMSDDLISTGISKLRCSINGLNADDYKKYTGVAVDYEKLLKSIKYFYLHKSREMMVYVKIMDYMVAETQTKNKFLDDFSKISDVQNIEYVWNASDEMDNSKLMKSNYANKNMRGGIYTQTEVCALPFYTLCVNIDGTISACCRSGCWLSSSPDLIVGDLKKDSMKEIWNGEKIKKLYCELLGPRERWNQICRECEYYMPNTYPEDRLDAYREKLKEFYKL